eukprot:4455938-Pyramimonas_sp.AAC.1
MLASPLPSTTSCDEADIDDEINRRFVCQIPSRGLRCGTPKQLVTRQSKSRGAGRGMPWLLATLQVDNACVVCQIAFPTQDRATR